jgi:hypothetical protein
MAALVTLALFVLSALLAWVAIAQPGTLWRKDLALVVLALYVPVAVFGVIELLGRPKPLALSLGGEVRHGATVVGSLLREHEAIYLWLVLPGESAPRAYVAPWDTDQAKALQEAAKTASELRTPLMVELTDADRAYLEQFKLTFHAVPPLPLPDKPAPEPDDSLVYERDD